MTDEPTLGAQSAARAEFDRMVSEFRAELHRYCARMTGSAVDGEDVVQEALAKAYYRLPNTRPITNLRGWLFRIAHNKALDHLRRYDVRFGEPLDDHPPPVVDDPPLESHEIAEFGFRVFLRLTPLQRSTVIMKDVMDYSLAEISEVLDTSVGAIKGALSRGRAKLRGFASELDEHQRIELDEDEVGMLSRYVDHFNAREFDALRDLLADDVRLDLVGRLQATGTEAVGGYYGNYSRTPDWKLAVGRFDGRPAILVSDPDRLDRPPLYAMLLELEDGRVLRIRDFRYARHVMEGADVEASA